MRFLLATAAVLALGIMPAQAGIVPARCVADPPWEGPPQVDSPALPPVPTLANEPMGEEVADGLRDRVETLLERTNAAAATVTIWHPDAGRTSLAIGAETEDAFWWASTTKLVTAALVLQLDESGALDLADSIDAWFPEFPGAEKITVDQLLRHTSGVFSFNSDRRLREKTGYTSPQNLLDVAAGHGLDFCPGTNWNYSNTGYVMLALIAEKVTGQPFADLVQERIAQPLGLSSLRVLTPNSPMDFVAPFDTEEPVGSLATVHGAGGMVATSADMAELLRAYLAGEIIPRPAVERALAALYPLYQSPMAYGRGVMLTRVPDPERPAEWIGHAGGAPNGKGLLIYDVAARTIIAIAFDRQGPAEAMANDLLKGPLADL